MAGRSTPPNGYARFAIEGQTAKGVDWANIFWCATVGGLNPTPAQLVTLAEAFYGFFNTHLWVLQGKDAHLQRCVVNYYGAGLQYVDEYAASTAGGSADDTEVDSLSACLSWTIGATWRGGKPRTYMAALPTNAFADSNTLASTYITALETGAAAFLTAVNGYNVAPFTVLVLNCLSFFSDNAPRVPPIGFGVSGVTVHPRIDSMRKRLGREVS